MTAKKKADEPAVESRVTADSDLGEHAYAGEGTTDPVYTRPVEGQPGTPEHLGNAELPYAGAGAPEGTPVS